LPADIRHRQPVLADDDDAGVGVAEDLVDGFAPLDAGFEGPDVPEHPLRVKGVQTVVEAAGVSPAVLSTVVDEDLARFHWLTMGGESGHCEPMPPARQCRPPLGSW
jgi:hypothetical protein